ncbi:hypothetical protein SVAN01_10758 [Stagonosporopsis vannaccii]|nr:hypothetical protein SVAN01_10758 [Stagonosporopsis vannaccii]
MAAPGARMRLTVVVEALAEENAHGEHRDMALAAFKERKFAMPVQLDDSFETVWRDIEHRYKTNYLSPQQAAAFSIKKLQDAYDCDLDMSDTVGAIFEGEPDRKMHLIKVVPHFIYRETSVVPGSMLRPTGAQKRAGDDAGDVANKRRRIESLQRSGTHDTRDPSPNRPLPSTESLQPARPDNTDIRSARSRSGVSLLELSRNETGQAPFSSNGVKQEPAEPEQPPPPNAVEAASSHGLPDAPPIDDELPEPERETPEEQNTAAPERTASAQLNTQESAIHKSPVSSAELAPAASTKRHRDVYRVPSSPEFMHSKAAPEKPAKTYGRSPRSGAELLNMARRLGRNTKETGTAQPAPSASTTNTIRAFQRTQPDKVEPPPRQPNGSSGKKSQAAMDIGDNEEQDKDLTASFLEDAASTTPSNAQTPARKTAVSKPAKPGSLKKPSRASLVATPASARRAVTSKAAATPASTTTKTTTTTKSSATNKEATLLGAGSPKGEKRLGEETLSRMERLEKLLNTSQHRPKCQGDVNSPARSDSVKSHDRNHKSSPEVRIPVPRKLASAKANAATIQARPPVQSPPARNTSIKSPVPLPPSKIQKSAHARALKPENAVEVPQSGNPNNFREPAAKVLKSPALTTPVNKTSPSASTGIPKRSEIPLPPNVRHLRRSSSLQASPLSTDNIATNGSGPSGLSTTSTPQLSRVLSKKAADDSAEPPSAARPVIDPVIISSANASSVECSDTDDEQRRQSPIRDTKDIALETKTTADSQSFFQLDAAKQANKKNDAMADKARDPSKEVMERTQLRTAAAAPSQIGTQPPSGQSSSQVARADKGWSLESLSHTNHASNMPQADNEHHATMVAVSAAPTSEDEGFAEQDVYSTAIEDNASRSRSNSANASLRSSPAISRRPARFLSHSPTPAASESEGDSDEASQALSRATSPQANDRDESDSESSSINSSDDDDVETPNPHANSIVGTNTNAAPASSPPAPGIRSSTPKNPQASRSTPTGNSPLVHRTPIPLPTQQSSQAPRSSQSVSVQAADRRRYTGFRSLREQLADTKAAQATTQKKTFDPRTMSLGRLMKGKPFAGLGAGDDESSDDDSSSSSSSDDSD